MSEVTVPRGLVPQKNKVRRKPQVVVSVPLIDPVIDAASSPDLSFEVPEGIATYRHVSKIIKTRDGVPVKGVCEICGIDLYGRASNIIADHMVGNALAVYVVSSTNEPPITYCQDHDPTKAHRLSSGVDPTVDGKIIRK